MEPNLVTIKGVFIDKDTFRFYNRCLACKDHGYKIGSIHYVLINKQFNILKII